MAVIGYEPSEQLDVEPAKYFVAVTKREKRACRYCGGGGVVAAPVPARIIKKGLASDRFVIDTVVSKYSDHLPLYRQSAIIERETGVDISRGTLDGWVMRVGELLSHIAAAIQRELLAGTYIQADETPVDVQMHDRRGQNQQAYLWQYGRPGGVVVFDFRLGRRAKDRSSFWETTKDSYKPTAIPPMTKSAARRWCTRRAGRTRAGSSSRRTNSARARARPRKSLRSSTGCSP